MARPGLRRKRNAEPLTKRSRLRRTTTSADATTTSSRTRSSNFDRLEPGVDLNNEKDSYRKINHSDEANAASKIGNKDGDDLDCRNVIVVSRSPSDDGKNTDCTIGSTLLGVHRKDEDALICDEELSKTDAFIVTQEPVTPPTPMAVAKTTRANKPLLRSVSSSPVGFRSSEHNGLPEGVTDLYPSDAGVPFECAHLRDDCSEESLTAMYMQTYGKLHYELHKSREEPTLPLEPVLTLSPTLSESEQTFSSATSPDESSEKVILDPSAVQALGEPEESVRYLPFQPDLTPKMRSILVDWMIELSDHFHFSGKTLHLAVSLMDRFLACGPLMDDDDDKGNGIDLDSSVDRSKQGNDSDGDSNTRDSHDSSLSGSHEDCLVISRERFQLLGAVCTWIACKMEEVKPPTVHDIAYLADSIYTVSQIKRMERRVCKALSFRLGLTTPHSFLYEFLRASHARPHAQLYHLASYLLDLARLPYAPATSPPSLLAASAVYLARVTLGLGPPWTATLAHYTGYRHAQLESTVRTIHRYHVTAEESSLRSAFGKYESEKSHRVALKAAVRACDLGF